MVVVGAAQSRNLLGNTRWEGNVSACFGWVLGFKVWVLLPVQYITNRYQYLHYITHNTTAEKRIYIVVSYNITATALQSWSAKNMVLKSILHSHIQKRFTTDNVLWFILICYVSGTHHIFVHVQCTRTSLSYILLTVQWGIKYITFFFLETELAAFVCNCIISFATSSFVCGALHRNSRTHATTANQIRSDQIPPSKN